MIIAAACALVGTLILALAVGYLGWYLSHKQYSDGFQLGYAHGREEMYNQMKPTTPNLRPVK